MESYDPLTPPDPETWDDLDELERISLVEQYHKKARIRLPNLELHAILHTLVENQVALGDELPVKETLERLMSEGLDRHDAVHAIAAIVTEHIHHLLMQKPRDLSHAPYYARLRELTAVACRGVHFALKEDEVVALRSILDERDRVSYLAEVIEENYFANHPGLVAESDKAWDAIHRVLADGELTWDGGEYPLNHVVLAGELLCTGDDYIMSLKTPQQVRDITAALPGITETGFRERYFAIDPASYGMDISEDDFCYTWEWLQPVRDLYARAAVEGRYVLFTADQ